MLRRLLGEPRRSTLSCVKHTRAAFVNTASSLSLVTLHFKWTFFSVSSLAGCLLQRRSVVRRSTTLQLRTCVARGHTAKQNFRTSMKDV